MNYQRIFNIVQNFNFFSHFWWSFINLLNNVSNSLIYMCWCSCSFYIIFLKLWLTNSTKNRSQNSRRLLRSSTKTETAPSLPKFFILYLVTRHCYAIVGPEPHWSLTARHDQRGRRRWQWNHRFPWIFVFDGQVAPYLDRKMKDTDTEE